MLRAPNGWGKSVLLRVLAGWGEEIHGVRVDGEFVFGGDRYHLPLDAETYAKQAKRRIATLFHRLDEESFGVTFGEELEQIQLRYQKGCGHFPEPCQELLDRLAGIGWDTPMDGVAKGLRQVLAVIDTFADVMHCEVVVLDEPTSYLADELFEELLRLLAWAREVNPSCAILVASHDQRFATVGARILRPTAISEHYASRLIVNTNLARFALESARVPNPVGFIVSGSPIAQGRRLAMHYQAALPAGRSAMVTGPNGSGKSTLLLMIAGFFQVRGCCQITTADGAPVRRSRVLRSNLGVVFQEPHEYEFRSTVEDMLRAGPWLPSTEQAEWDEFIRSLLSSYQILPEQQPRTLSSGQLRIVWLASQLGWCSTWLLDEVTASLDNDSISLAESLLSIHVGRGGSVVAVDAHSRANEIKRVRTVLGGNDRCDVIKLGIKEDCDG